ncbi:transporter substrate-binding domain-containing protein [Ferrimonas gelatinilytica]|uniref:Transporter substrate-binding domain-containing protein n=1 Tax=Ferrimonas gelatinilytica TaxID=1255257 RepID=A0ABP9S0Z8_9GAMM
MLGAWTLLGAAPAWAKDLEEIKEAGVLRHIGIPYAHFVASYRSLDGEQAQGFDVELIQAFARHLGVEYRYVPASWRTAVGQLTGRHAVYAEGEVVLGEAQAVEGDLVASGVTLLPWRESLVDFSDPYFPSAVWLVARSDSSMQPIVPSGDVKADIEAVKKLMAQRTVLAMRNSCLDPSLYQLELTDAEVVLPKQERQLNEMVPAILNKDAESTLLDVPDIVIALEKWPGQIKVVGPVSEVQEMGVVFRRESPQLREAFNEFLAQIRADGTYMALVNKHFPSMPYFFPDFFDPPQP